MAIYRRALAFTLLLGMSACAPARVPIPLGEVPPPPAVSAEDERYGQEVVRQLTLQFPITNDWAHTQRVLNVVHRLVRGAGSNPDDWKVFVLESRDMANAAATRGNYVVVWTAMLNAVPDDHELSAVLAHEIGHVLAAHTHTTPDEQANELITGVAGIAAGQYIGGGAGQLAEAVVTEMLKGFLINPESQRKEFEADEIGLFIMADAGYDPRAALGFWRRAARDPRFSRGIPEFFSTHPSSESRLQRIESLLPRALDRYHSRR